MRFGTEQVRYDVEEVVVHGSSWEVVVHVATVVEVVVLVTVVVHDGDGSGSSGSRTSWEVVEVVVYGDGSCTRSFRRCPGSPQGT